MDLIDHISKGGRQEDIMHAPRIRPTVPTSVLIHLWQKIKSQMRSKNLCRRGRGREFAGEA
jgi:hypothetical protein